MDDRVDDRMDGDAMSDYQFHVREEDFPDALAPSRSFAGEAGESNEGLAEVVANETQRQRGPTPPPLPVMGGGAGAVGAVGTPHHYHPTTMTTTTTTQQQQQQHGRRGSSPSVALGRQVSYFTHTASPPDDDDDDIYFCVTERFRIFTLSHTARAHFPPPTHPPTFRSLPLSLFVPPFPPPQDVAEHGRRSLRDDGSR